MPSFFNVLYFPKLLHEGHSESWQKWRLGSGAPEEMRSQWLWQESVACRAAVLQDR